MLKAGGGEGDEEATFLLLEIYILIVKTRLEKKNMQSIGISKCIKLCSLCLLLFSCFSLESNKVV